MSRASVHRLAAVLLFAASSVAQAQPAAEAPLVLKRRVLDGVAYVESWASLHEVRGLKATGDGFLAVRAGPATTFAERDRLANGRTVFVFETKGQWAGIVYPPSADHEIEAVARRCGFDEIAARAMPLLMTYGGPCSWGWVHRRWLVNLSD